MADVRAAGQALFANADQTGATVISLPGDLSGSCDRFQNGASATGAVSLSGSDAEDGTRGAALALAPAPRSVRRWLDRVLGDPHRAPIAVGQVPLGSISENADNDVHDVGLDVCGDRL